MQLGPSAPMHHTSDAKPALEIRLPIQLRSSSKYGDATRERRCCAASVTALLTGNGVVRISGSNRTTITSMMYGRSALVMQASWQSLPYTSSSPQKASAWAMANRYSVDGLPCVPPESEAAGTQSANAAPAPDWTTERIRMAVVAASKSGMLSV